MKKIVTGILVIFTLGASAQTLVATSDASLTGGWIKVYSEGRIGYLDEAGSEVIPALYDEIGHFGDYCDNAALVEKDGLYGLIDSDGNKITEAIYEEIGKPGEYNPDWILVKLGGLYGFIDCSGQEIVKPAYTEIEGKSDGVKIN